MSGWRRNGEAAQRTQERRRREDEAARLRAEVPSLATLRIDLEHTRGGSALAETAHAKHVVVAHAPAIFDFPCREQGCVDGGHDVTIAILNGLREGKQQFTGECNCRGTVGSNGCARVLRYVAAATYH